MMKMRSAIFLALFLIGCSNSMQVMRAAKEEHDKRRQEFAEVEGQVLRNRESICFNGRIESLNLFYGFQGAGPRYVSQTLPQLEPDLLRSVVEKTGRFQIDPEVEQALSGPVNEVLNSRLPKLNDGTYNTVYIRIRRKGHRSGQQTSYIGVTPGLRPSGASADPLLPARDAAVMVWLPENFERRKGIIERKFENSDQVFIDTSIDDSVWAFSGSGKLIFTPDQSLGLSSRSELSRSFSHYVDFSRPRQMGIQRDTPKCTSRVP